jgi:predicted ATP-dependent endonuclease of OLD family
MDIKRLRIQNFRCYNDASIKLDRSLLLITGSNDGGKSALLRAIELFLYSRAKPDRADFRSLDPDGEDAADEIRLIAHVQSDGKSTKIRRRFWIEEGQLEWAYEEEREVPKDEKLRRELSTFKKDRSADEQREYLEELGYEEFGSNKDKRYQQLKDYADEAPTVTDWVKISTSDFPVVNR